MNPFYMQFMLISHERGYMHQLKLGDFHMSQLSITLHKVQSWKILDNHKARENILLMSILVFLY